MRTAIGLAHTQAMIVAVRRSRWVLIFLGCFSLSSAWAFGRRKAAPVVTNPPAHTQGAPARMVGLPALINHRFVLPNQQQTLIDSGVLLREIVVAELGAEGRKFRPLVLDVGDSEAATDTPTANATPGAISNIQNSRYIFRGGLIAFEANNTTLGVRIGFAPGIGTDIGSGVVTSAQGAVDVAISRLEFALSIIDSTTGEIIASSSASGRPTEVGARVSVNFGAIQTGADFVHRSAMAPLFRSAIRKSIQGLEANPQWNRRMDWQARVIGLFAPHQTIVMNAGLQDNIQERNVFTVYKQNRIRIGEVKVVRVGFDSCEAQYIPENSSRTNFEATDIDDVVKIFYF